MEIMCVSDFITFAFTSPTPSVAGVVLYTMEELSALCKQLLVMDKTKELHDGTRPAGIPLQISNVLQLTKLKQEIAFQIPGVMLCAVDFLILLY